MKKKFAFVILAFYATVAIAASNWIMVASNNNNSIFYIDKNSIELTINGSKIMGSAWFKEDASKNKTKKYNISMMLYQADCNNKSLKLIQYVDYDTNGNTISSGKSSVLDDFDYVAPESIGETFLIEICDPRL